MRKTWLMWGLGVLAGCGSTTIPMAPNPSPHFGAVADNLQLGGTVYAYVDIDGDAERAASFLISLLDGVPGADEAARSDGRNPRQLARDVGLADVDAIGMSSYRQGDLYHNRSFIYRSGPRQGVLALFGADPAAFELPNVSTPATDFIWELRLDLGALIDVVRALGTHGVGPSPASIDRTLNESVGGLDVTLGALLQNLERIGLTLELDESRILRVPGSALWFPFTNFLFQLDGVGALVDALERRSAFDPFLRSQSTAERRVVSLGIRLPPPWNAYDPQLVEDLRSGRVYLSSNPAFLEQSLTSPRRVTEAGDYEAVFAELPTQGNGMLFMSRRLTRELHGLLDRWVNESGAGLGTALARFFLPDGGLPVGWVAQNRPDGVLFTSNSPSSHKSTLVTLAYATVLPVIVAMAASKASKPPPPPFPSFP
ncbi:MAG: hypothetical protein AAF500_13275 [Myxococcota bacterium]